MLKPSEIIQQISKYYNVDPEGIKTNRSKKREVCEPRQLAIYFIFRCTSLTSKEIAKEFGFTGNASVQSAIDKIKALISTDERIKHVVGRLTQILQIE
jgi:chromosomal replication initiator protein